MNTLRRASKIVALLCLLGLGLAVPAHAQPPQERDAVNEVAGDLYCPLCSGLTVDVCELEVCADMRDTIAAKLAAGESPEEIRAYFVGQYGQKVLGKPATEGFHLTAWLMPFAMLLTAALILVAWLRGRPIAQPAPARAARPANEYEARLERELQRLEE